MKIFKNYRQELPNLITTSRVILIPFLILFYFIENDDFKRVTFIIFALASISDFLDGYLSRKWQVTSRYGAMMDPIADKLIVGTALILLVSTHTSLVIPAIAIICREIFVSGLREFLGKSEGFEMPVTKIAKWKTAAQMVAISILLLCSSQLAEAHRLNDSGFYFGSILLWMAAYMTLYTGYQYYAAAKQNKLL